MNRRSRREFLEDVGRGMLVASLGSAAAIELGVAPCVAEEVGQRLTFGRPSIQSILAFLYLTVFGSIIAFTAYSWLVKATSASRAITSSYVNPVVAVLLGWGLRDEPLTYRMVLAMVTIILGVAVISTAKKPT